MVYLYDACDQVSDFCHQQLLRKMRQKISWTDGRTDRGKTVYPPPPSGSGGIIISPLLWHLLLPHSSNNFFVGWTLAGFTWLLTHPDSIKRLAAFFFFFFFWFSVLSTKCNFLSALFFLYYYVNILYTHITWCSFKFVLYLRHTYILAFQAI
jgi:hypothetical protein